MEAGVPRGGGRRTHGKVVKVVGPVLQLLEAPAGRGAVVRGQAGGAQAGSVGGGGRTHTRAPWHRHGPCSAWTQLGP